MAPRINEFDLIRRHFAPLSAGEPGAWALQDDAATLRPEDGMEFLLSADAIVSGVHFPEQTAPADIARRALRVNLSDIAAKGARPRGYTLALQLPDTVDNGWLSAFASGLSQDQEEFGLALLGGDTTRTPGPLTVTINIIGEIVENNMILRSGAQVGNDVHVTGTIGDAAIGLALATGAIRTENSSDAAALKARFLRPEPRLNVGPELVGVASASADVSDGLVADLGHICSASQTAAEIAQDLVPFSDATARLVTDNQPLRTGLLTGGDDYEIVFTAPETERDTVAAIATVTGVSITRIGRINARASDHGLVTVRDAAGNAVEAGDGGYRHFGGTRPSGE